MKELKIEAIGEFTEDSDVLLSTVTISGDRDIQKLMRMYIALGKFIHEITIKEFYGVPYSEELTNKVDEYISEIKSN